jgi:hypothetical protein
MSPTLSVILVCIFLFFFVAAQSVGFGIPEMICTAVMALGVGILFLGVFFLGGPSGREYLDPVRQRWLSVAGVGVWVMCLGGLPLFVLCLKRTWQHRRRIFPFFYGETSDQPGHPADAATPDEGDASDDK